MFRRLLRVISGFALANIVGGVSLTLCVIPPLDIMDKTDQLTSILWLMGITSLQCGIFSFSLASFILIGFEWYSVRKLPPYILMGLLLGTVAYFLYFKDHTAAPSLLQDFAFHSLLMSSIVGTATYWAVAGRKAGQYPK